MNAAAGSHDFVKLSSANIVEHLIGNAPEVKAIIAAATGAKSESEIEQHRIDLLASFSGVQDMAAAEVPPPYTHYASRFDMVGVYQSVLSGLFSDIPALQGYGDRNAVWLTTPLEESAFKIKAVLHGLQAMAEQKKSPLQAIVEAWRAVRFAKAPYPQGAPPTRPFAETCTVALLADWGGDNPAAKRIAEIVERSKPSLAVHLGDIYYGGVKEECEAFLRNWPLQVDPAHRGNGIPPLSSLALNGNHEMYTGGEAFFNVVLPAFGQSQPFFCLENEHWRLIGLDTAYLDGRLKPTDANDPMMVQWNWLVDLLKNGSKKANIFLSHHQPVSAHAHEYKDSKALRDDVEELLALEGVGKDAIFGWFFGHEHRCTVYKDDDATPYNARLIGSGCIPHSIQRETSCDPGCNPFVWVSGRGEDGSTQAAISEYAELRFIREFLEIVYIDERGTALGAEQWNARNGRLHGVPFAPDKTTYAQE